MIINEKRKLVVDGEGASRKMASLVIGQMRRTPIVRVAIFRNSTAKR
jgi:hypothetical protein